MEEKDTPSLNEISSRLDQIEGKLDSLIESLGLRHKSSVPPRKRYEPSAWKKSDYSKFVELASVSIPKASSDAYVFLSLDSDLKSKLQKIQLEKSIREIESRLSSEEFELLKSYLEKLSESYGSGKGSTYSTKVKSHG